MSVYILLKGKNHDKCICDVESNSFGDQILTYRYETVGGAMFYASDRRAEGDWVDSVAMRAFARYAFRTVWGE
jgi:hypothetical protein